jgi:acyl-CoA oxidase
MVVTRGVNDLCGVLRPHARTLVDAFGIPEAALTAPILTSG